MEAAEGGTAKGKVLAETQGTGSFPELNLRMGEGTRLHKQGGAQGRKALHSRCSGPGPRSGEHWRQHLWPRLSYRSMDCEGGRGAE